MNPRSELEKGVNLLLPALEPSGFKYEFKVEGQGSGGPFASCYFVSGNKYLELSFRYSLGCVKYRVSSTAFNHRDYMDAIGVRSKAKYPGFSSEPIKAFEHLAYDISNFADVFLTGSEDEFIKLINSYKDKPKRSGFAALSNNET